MERLLGRTGLRVTRLGLGLAALGRPGYINLGHARDLGADTSVEALRHHTHEVMDAADSLGIRYFDAARSYGRSEEFVADWLSERRPAERPCVGSKWGYVYTADWQRDADRHEVKDHSLANLQAQTRQSRALLGENLSLYQVHSATLQSGVLEDAAVLRELALLKSQGLHVGLSLSGPEQAQTLEKGFGVLVDGQPLFECVQATWNLLEPSAGSALQKAHERGWGVIVKESVANGRLSPRGEGQPHYSPVESAAGTVGLSVDAFAIAAVLAQPWVDVVLSGAGTVEQLRSHCSALAAPVSAELIEQVKKQVSLPSTRYWTERSALHWT
jgi:aryl-alcohol dehydrogenase-like predicted oxidoreductase